jgi:hypothetical protein
MPQYKTNHIKKNKCHTARHLTKEITTHTTLKDDYPHMKNTCHNIRQLTYGKKTHATISDNSHMKKKHATI